MSQKHKYSEDDVMTLEDMYSTLGTSGIPIIAEKLGRTEKSVIAKLVRMGIYTPVKKVPKRTGASKKELLRQLEDILGFDTVGFTGSSKAALTNLLEFLTND